MSTGMVAYEAYRSFSGGKSLISGQEIPPFEKLSQQIQDAWQAAADAALASTGKIGIAGAPLGEWAMDKVSGFRGIVTARCEYVGGGHRVQLQPKVGTGADQSPNSNEFTEPEWFDEGRIEVLR